MRRKTMPINIQGVFDIFRNRFKLGNAGLRLGAKLIEQSLEKLDRGLPSNSSCVLFIRMRQMSLAHLTDARHESIE